MVARPWIDVIPINDHLWMGMHPDDLHLNGGRPAVIATDRTNFLDEPLELERALFHPRWPNALRWDRSQAGSVELFPLIAELSCLVRRDGILAGQRGELFVERLPLGAQAQQNSPAQCPRRGHRREVRALARLGLPQPRVSSHLALLRKAGLVSADVVGRQRIYRVDAKRVTALMATLRALTTTAQGRRPKDAKVPQGRPPRSAQAAREVRRNTAIRQARTCYDHLAGVAGVQLLDEMLRRGWVVADGVGRPLYRLTPQGAQALTDRGVNIPLARKSRRVFGFACLDWTERRPHLGGSLGAAILRALEDAGAIRREKNSRTVTRVEPVTDWLDGPASQSVT